MLSFEQVRNIFVEAVMSVMNYDKKNFIARLNTIEFPKISGEDPFVALNQAIEQNISLDNFVECMEIDNKLPMPNYIDSSDVAMKMEEVFESNSIKIEIADCFILSNFIGDELKLKEYLQKLTDYINSQID